MKKNIIVNFFAIVISLYIIKLNFSNFNLKLFTIAIILLYISAKQISKYLYEVKRNAKIKTRKDKSKKIREDKSKLTKATKNKLKINNAESKKVKLIPVKFEEKLEGRLEEEMPIPEIKQKNGIK